MLKISRYFLFSLILLTLFFFKQDAANSQDGTFHRGAIIVGEAKGPVTPVMAHYIERIIDLGIKEQSPLVVILLDTPGGLDSSMRMIIQKMVNSPIPVAVYVWPPGGRAASAGVFITMGAHIAAMSPTTNIGAAHPVNLGGGGEKDGKEEKGASVMSQKVTNDAVAFIKGVAGKYGRNVEWAEKAIRKSESITAKEALELKVIDYVAKDLQDLLAWCDGKTIPIQNGTAILKTKGAITKDVKMTWAEHFLFTISDPNIAYIFLMIGIYGMIYELASPGSVLPGTIGAISLLLAFYSLGALPVNYVGLFFIILAFILLVLELKIASNGVLTVGGLASLVLGSMMLINTDSVFGKVSWSLIGSVVAFTTLFFLVALAKVIKVHKRPVVTGESGLIGNIGVTKTSLSPYGNIFVAGSFWKAVSVSGNIQEGVRVRVVEVDNLLLKVTPVDISK